MIRAILALTFCALPIAAQNWPQFRGPNASGVAEADRLPTHFGPDKNVVWKTEIPSGHSSPILAGDRLFLTAADGGKASDAGREKIVDEGGRLYTICIDRKTGKILWQREAPRPRLERYQPTNSPASPSPVVDDKAVYVFFGDFGLISYTLDGKERWKVPLGPFNNANGHGTSPIIFENLVILLCDQDTDSYLLAVNKDNGKVVWKADRSEFTRSYSTPVVYRPADGPPELIVPGSYQLTSYNARTGEKLWWVTGLSWQPKSSPVIAGDLIIAHWWENGGEAEEPTQVATFEEMLARHDTDKDGRLTREELAAEPGLQRGFLTIDLNANGYIEERDWNYYRARRMVRNKMIAVRHGGRGDLTENNVVWSMQKFLPNVPSPLLYEGVLYIVKDGGILTALDPKTGKIHKQGRLTGAVDTYYASPVGAAGKVYFLSQQGKAVVLKAGKQWEILAVHDMGEECFATPAIADDRLYLRTRTALYCFEER
ncbi:MAG: PQQ-binding-like beta-propeller repeat protein [Bryobacteraceae bacterium]